MTSADVNSYLETGDVTYDAAISRALTDRGGADFSGKPELGDRAYTIDNPIVVSSGQALVGNASADCIIACTAPNLPVVALGQALDTFDISGLTLTHMGQTVEGGDGLFQGQGLADYVVDGRLQDVVCTGNQKGFSLGKAFYAEMSQCQSQANAADGFGFLTSGQSIIRGAPGGGPMQWYLAECVAARNGGAGYNFGVTGVSDGGPGAGSSLGTMSDCTTYANARGGLRFQGTATQPLNSARVYGGFFGNDGAGGVASILLLDTFGRDHVLSPDFVEYGGLFNVDITENNANVAVSLKQCSAAFMDGLRSAGDNVMITGGNYVNNGLAGYGSGPTQPWAGIRTKRTGSATITGLTSRNWNGLFQSYGVYIEGENVIITGCRLPGPGVMGSTPGTINGGIGTLTPVGNHVAGIGWLNSPVNSVVTGNMLAT